MLDFDDFLDLFGLGGDNEDDGEFETGGGELGEGALPSQMGAEGVLVDFDGDGIPDAMVYQQLRDIDGDGIPDMVVTEQRLDTDGDGRFDTVRTDLTIDFDHDGITDLHSVVIGRDTDGDGIVDWTQTAEDFNNDGIFDSVREYSGLEGPNLWENGDSGFLDGCAPAYETFDPDRADMDRVIGDPEDAMDNWHWQETGTSCAVASQEFVLEQLTGREFNESDLRELAEEQGWYSPEGGTPMDDVGNILEHMGLTVERSQGNTLRDLEECLQNGGEVIVGVDSSEIWEGRDNDFFGPGMDADHAVQVIGLDYSDPGNPMVILNDPGAANGGGAMISLDVFMGAWEDSGCFMVEAYA